MPSPESIFRDVTDVLADVRADATRRVAAGDRRRRRGAVVAAAAVVVVGLVAVGAAVGIGGSDDDPTTMAISAETTSTTAAPESGPAPGETLAMAEAPIEARWNAISAWTGDELLVWGGTSSISACEDAAQCGDPILTDGARYDPGTDTWRTMAPSPIPADRDGLWGVIDGVWTGSELIVVGGRGPTVAAYDPEEDSWRTIDPGRADVTYGMRTYWTGSEVVLLGGLVEGSDSDDPGVLVTAESLVLDPTSDTWRTLPEPPLKKMVVDGIGTGWVPMSLSHALAAPLGSELLVSEHSGDAEIPAHVAALDAATGSWRSLAPMPPGIVEALVSTDDGAIAVLRSSEAATAGRIWATVYDPRADTWSEPIHLGGAWLGEPARWTGTELLVPLIPDVTRSPDGLDVIAFDPATGATREWEMDATDRSDPAMVWTGDQLLVWGGAEHILLANDGVHRAALSDGVRYRPE